MTTQERYKALATMTIMRQVVIADTVYYLVSEAKEMQPELKGLEKLKERSLGFVTRIGTYLRGGKHRIVQAAITSYIEENTAVQLEKAIATAAGIFEQGGLFEPKAAAYIFLAHALMSGANASVNAVMGEVKRAQGLTQLLISIRNYELEQSLKAARDVILREIDGVFMQEEIEDMYKAASDYATLLLSENIITDAIKDINKNN